MSRAVCESEVSLHPRAKCLGNDPDPDAPSNCARTWPSGATTLAQVKNHVKQTGHQVLTVRETRSVYGRSS